MIFGIGTDIVDIKRIQKSMLASDKFAKRILTNLEQREFVDSQYPERYLAKKFAAKEALVKAMGTGIGRGISWQMSQVLHNDLGRPYFEVFGGIDEFFTHHAICACHLSISDEQAYANAFVVLESAPINSNQ